MLIAGRFRFVLMRGTSFRHRSARLNRTKLTEDDLSIAEEAAGLIEPQSSTVALAYVP
ncbi:MULTISPECIES: hypothetical protein [unclassified Bradyrhizobium]|uniref:hypothetical protein n=1 Tax=unclassified Bradyrhizobium TaxID=2631580 RepID=UPI001FFA938C|nr:MULTISPECIES: hypothetical protein [unclassified Bradyrhizobium]